MPTQLPIATHIAALQSAGESLHAAAASAGMAAAVPTCPDWTVRNLVAHQGMVHRWATAQVGGVTEYDTVAAEAEGLATTDILDWFDDGLRALMSAINETPEDRQAMVFLADAPPPRQFWARRQAHETTIHGIDALAAQIGGSPSAAETYLPPALAADGIDELLTGFLPRKSSRLRADEPFDVVIAPTDVANRWTVHVTAGHPTTRLDEAANPDVVLSGTATQLYLGLWNRSDEITSTGRADVLDIWRAQVQVRWTR